MNAKVLFVEGTVDDYFFKQLIATDPILSTLNIDVQPKGGVSKVIKTLEETDFLDKFKDGSLIKLAIIADADHNGIDTGGFNKRWNKFSTLLANWEFVCPQMPSRSCQGSLFQHQDYYPIGLWLMPNHYDDGSLEDLVLNTIAINQTIVNGISQNQLITKVDEVIIDLNTNHLKTFQSHHDAKAKAFTWLAWQKKPRHFIGEVIDSNNPQNNLIDINSQEIQGLLDWLKQVFI